MDSSLAQIEIMVEKPKKPELVELPIVEETPPRIVEGVEIQAKLSLEEKELKKRIEADRILAKRDEYGAIAIQTSS